MRNKYHCHSFENLNKMNFPGVGIYHTPSIKAQRVICNNWIPFNFAGRYDTGKRSTTGIHFFIDDYQFVRVWTHPDAYIGQLQQFAFVCSPDFSLYTDMPLALQLYNHYRKHWVAAYWQLHGIQVVPTISWSTTDSYTWCFDGEPTHTPVAVSSVGCLREPESRQLFIAGYREMLARLQPTQILLYGQLPDVCNSLAPTISMPVFTNELTRRRKNGWQR